MKVNRKVCMLFSAFALVLLVCGEAGAEAAHERRIRMATNLINEMASKDDAADMADVIKSGKGIAIFPSVTKAGLGIGGQNGQGVVFLRDGKGGWMGPAFMGITGGSIGFQIGVSSVGLVLVITNQEGLHAFTGGNSFKLGGNVSVAAGPVGREASAATDARAKASIYSYSISKGLFAGMAIDGSVINQNRDASKAYWGKDTTANEALKRPAKDKRVQGLINALNNLVKKAK